MSESKKNSFVLYHDIREPLELLSDAERGRLLTAILNDSEYGELPDVRAVTRLIQRERLHGAPICASCDAARAGFYLARSPGELARYLRALQGRIGATTATHTALLAVYDDWTGQQRLDGWGVL